MLEKTPVEVPGGSAGDGAGTSVNGYGKCGGLMANRARYDKACRHYCGSRDTYTCGAGVNMLDFNGGSSYGFIRKLPCWGGETFSPDDPPIEATCQHYSPLTKEEIEARERDIAEYMDAFMGAREAIVAEIKKSGNRVGKIACIKCGTGLLRFSQASVNDHIHAQCTTEGCLSWME